MDVVSILVGGAVGFLASIGSNLLLEGKKQREKEKQFKREKLEILYQDISKLHDNLLSEKIEDKYIGSKITSLLRFYFPLVFEEYVKYLYEWEGSDPDERNVSIKKILALLTEESKKL